MELEELYVNINKIDLCLNGQMVEFDTPPDILFNYAVTDFNSPASVKNSYTKQINIPGTDNNNNIFNHIYNLERIQGYTAMYSGSEFNPIRTTDFTLYVNGEVYESGYFKLNEVAVDRAKITYNVTLYGGLGSFFWCLSHNVGTDGTSDNPEPKKMSDLIFPCEKSNNPETLDFTINKETVADAWYQIYWHPDYKWGTINFAAAYNGIPESLEADKILIDKDEYADHFTFGNTQYDLVAAPRELTEWETHDLRSYLQRPMLRVRSVIEACCDPENNGGYTVDLDSHFFHGGNHYYEDAWCTLKTIPEMELKSEEEHPISLSDVSLGSRVYSTKVFPININNVDFSQYSNLTLSMNMILGGDIATQHTSPNLYTSRDFANSKYLGTRTDTKWFKYRSSVCVQLVGYDAMGNEIATSDVIELHTKMSDDWTKTKNPVYGYFKKMSDGRYIFVDDNGNTVNLRFQLNADSNFYGFGLKVTRPFAAKGKWHYKGGTTYNWTDYKYCRYDDDAPFLYGAKSESYSAQISWANAATRVALDFRGTKGGASFAQAMDYSMGSAKYFIPGITQLSAISKSNPDFLSGVFVPKEKLLSMDCTPADFFLSYCKLFGLYIWKEADTKVIHVMDRNTFYTQEVVNLEKYIDRGKTLKITPQIADSRWYDYNVDQIDGEAAKEYKSEYNQEYGNKRVNTNYNFNSDTKDVFNDNIFKSGVDVLEKSIYYKKPVMGVPPSLQNGASYSSFTAKSDGLEETEHSSPFTYGVSGLELNEEFSGYDFEKKVQFHSAENKAEDGSMVLGFVDKKITAGDAEYFITDDMMVMATLSDSPCWIATKGKHGIPVDQYLDFTRIIVDDTVGRPHNITHSFDFGNPMVTYIPNTYNTEDMGIYDRFWRDYVEDMYSVDNRLLKCYVLIQQKPHPEWLRRFYWFDNCIWRLNKITDWNVTTMDTTVCEFVKVLDKANYKIHKPINGADIKITIDDMVPTESYWSEDGTSFYTVYDFDRAPHNFVMSIKTQNGLGVDTSIYDKDFNWLYELPEWIQTSPDWESGGSLPVGKVNVELYSNTEDTKREVVLGIFDGDIRHAYIIIRQQEYSDFLIVDGPYDNDSDDKVDSVIATATDGRYYFDITTDQPSYSVGIDVPWITVSYKAKHDVWFAIEANPSTSPRTGYVTISAGSNTVTLPIVQDGRTRGITLGNLHDDTADVDVNYIQSYAEGRTYSIPVDTFDSNWTVTGSNSWMTAKKSADGTKILITSTSPVGAIYRDETLTGTLTVRGDGIIKTVEVKKYYDHYWSAGFSMPGMIGSVIPASGGVGYVFVHGNMQSVRMGNLTLTFDHYTATETVYRCTIPANTTSYDTKHYVTYSYLRQTAIGSTKYETVNEVRTYTQSKP